MKTKFAAVVALILTAISLLGQGVSVRSTNGLSYGTLTGQRIIATNIISTNFVGNFIGNGLGLTNVIAAYATNILDITQPPYNAVGDGVTDDTAAITNALRDSVLLGTEVYVPPRIYKVSPFTMYSGHKLVGYGSKLLFSSGSAGVGIAMDHTSTNIVIKGFDIDGGKALTMPLTDDGRTGLLIWDCQERGWYVEDLYVYGWGKGINIFGVLPNTTANLQFSSCTMEFNYVGLQIDPQAEYLNMSKVNCNNNFIGLRLYGGNNNFAVCDFSRNRFGMDLIGGSVSPNAAHSVMTACSFNHSVTRALSATNINFGFQFVGCEFLPPTMYLTNVQGIKFIGGMLGWDTPGNVIEFINSTNCHIVMPTNPYWPAEPNPITLTLTTCSNVDMATGLLLGTGAGATLANGLSTLTVGSLVATNTVTATNGYWAPTNALALWPTIPRWHGDAFWGNSNGVVYILTSVPGALTWAATNKIAP